MSIKAVPAPSRSYEGAKGAVILAVPQLFLIIRWQWDRTLADVCLLLYNSAVNVSDKLIFRLPFGFIREYFY